ncbi:hypothetical protein, partial [Enterobacter ludwigii]|uniref:hypothetical protein n=1 Tax=Enterobacter ludwigii TaxID=299767 RepID=UPI0013D6434E
MKKNEKEVSNLQPAADLNLPEEEPTSIELTESRDNRTNESDQQIHNLMPSMAAERDLLAARYAVPDNLKHITSLAEKYKGLMPSMAAERDLLAARYAVPDNLK